MQGCATSVQADFPLRYGVYAKELEHYGCVCLSGTTPFALHPRTPMNFRAYSPPESRFRGRRSAVILPIPIRLHIHFLGETAERVVFGEFPSRCSASDRLPVCGQEEEGLVEWHSPCRKPYCLAHAVPLPPKLLISLGSCLASLIDVGYCVGSYSQLLLQHSLWNTK